MNNVNAILEKLDKLDSRIDSIDITVARQHVTLEDHTRRSLANEQSVILLRQLLDIVRTESDARLKGLETHRDKVVGAIAVLGAIGTIMLGAKELGLF